MKLGIRTLRSRFGAMGSDRISQTMSRKYLEPMAVGMHGKDNISG